MTAESAHRDLKEAYLHDTLGEVILLNNELRQLREESMMRIGITQQIIEEQLTSAREVLQLYTEAANAHFTVKKEELRNIAEQELKTALVNAHRQLLISNPPKINTKDILLCVLLSSGVSTLISFACTIYFLK